MNEAQIIMAAIADRLSAADRECVILDRQLRTYTAEPFKPDAFSTGAEIGSGVGERLSLALRFEIAKGQAAAIRNVQVEIAAALGWQRETYEKRPTLFSVLKRLGAPDFDTVRTEQDAADLIVREFSHREAEIETSKRKPEQA